MLELVYNEGAYSKGEFKGRGDCLVNWEVPLKITWSSKQSRESWKSKPRVGTPSPRRPWQMKKPGILTQLRRVYLFKGLKPYAFLGLTHLWERWLQRYTRYSSISVVSPGERQQALLLPQEEYTKALGKEIMQDFLNWDSLSILGWTPWEWPCLVGCQPKVGCSGHPHFCLATMTSISSQWLPHWPARTMVFQCKCYKTCLHL